MFSIIGILLGFISILIGLISVYISISISIKTSSIIKKTDDRTIKEAIKETEQEDIINLDSDNIDSIISLMQSNGRKHDADYYYMLALKEYKNQYYLDAEELFQKAIEMKNGSYPAALFYLGHTYLKQSNIPEDEYYNKALACFKQAKDLGHKYAARRLEIMDNEK